jgi:hypothetical protein
LSSGVFKIFFESRIDVLQMGDFNSQILPDEFSVSKKSKKKVSKNFKNLKILGPSKF